MDLIGNDILQEFERKHSSAHQPIQKWRQAVSSARWRNFAELRATIPSADQLKSKRGLVATIFNIGGNKYRLISEVSYKFELVRVIVILTHAQYSQEHWKEKL
ncbi:MAG: type II toxin-antitoxin system HigB family toxin [Candidatus Sumerlaeia bacterium]